MWNVFREHSLSPPQVKGVTQVFEERSHHPLHSPRSGKAFCSVQRLYEQECTAVVRAGHTGTEQCERASSE